MTVLERIKAETRTLPRSDRLDLANELLNSFVEDTTPESDEAFLAELERRSLLTKSGALTSRPVEDIMAELKARFDRP
jgi:putative addiction module component (TIGR02574 family)